MKKWEVHTAQGRSVVVEADRMTSNQGKVEFMVGDEIVATFLGASSIFPAQEEAE